MSEEIKMGKIYNPDARIRPIMATELEATLAMKFRILLHALQEIADNHKIDRDGWTADEAFDHSRALAKAAIAKVQGE